MTGWPDEAREAAIRAVRADSGGCLWTSPERLVEYVFDALAPFVAAREAAAFRRGAEAMRDAAANRVRRLLLPDDCGPDEAHGRFQQAIASCEAICALPAPEDRNEQD